MIPRLLCCLVAVAALVSAALAPARANDGPAAFEVPPFLAGDRASYEGAFDYLLHIQTTTARLMDGTTATLPAAAPESRAFRLHDRLEAWDPATGTLLAQRHDCPARETGPSGDQCLPYVRWDWGNVGFPAALGIAVVQGARLSLGQMWATPRACETCALPTRFTVEVPHPDSPADTAFSLRVEPSDEGVEGWRLDMPSGSPYPLRVTLGGLHADLVLLERGDAPLDASATRSTTFASRPGAQPYADGIPTEGTPLPGWPAWSDARDATRSPPLPPGPGILTHVGVTRFDATLWAMDVRLNQSRETRIVVDAAAPGETTNARVTYSRTEPFPDLVGPVGLAPQWARTESTLRGPAPEDCPHTSIALWDLVRIAAEHAGRSDLVGWHFDNLSCGDETLMVSMPSPGPFYETAVVFASTGLLKERFAWVA